MIKYILIAIFLIGCQYQDRAFEFSKRMKLETYQCRIESSSGGIGCSGLLKDKPVVFGCDTTGCNWWLEQ